MNKQQKPIIGALETCSLPELGITDMTIRIDTGAKTSSLHVDNLKKYVDEGKTFVSFDLHPDIHNVETMALCKAAVTDIRKIKSSNGSSEQRYVITTPIKLGQFLWDIEITLTNRADMNYLMLLGREALGELFLVDPSLVFLNP